MAKKILYILTAWMIMLSCGCRLMAQTETFQWQGTQRQFIVKAPSSMDRPLPIVFFLHGLGDNITNVNNSFNLSQVANRYNWVIVAPQAINQGFGSMWNAGLLNSSIDDSGFLMALLDSLSNRYPVDQDSVFFTGFSMGGFMTHRMAIEHSDRINACAPVSGLITNALASDEPVAPVRLLHIHGTSDDVVGYNGYSPYFGMTLGKSVNEMMNYWKTANNCTAEVVIDTLPDLKNDGLRFVSYTYGCETELQHLKVIGGTHDWYVSSRNDIGYMEYIHDFFVGKTDGVENHNALENKGLSISPNPTSGIANININKATSIEIIDINGKVLLKRFVESGTSQFDLGNIPNGVYFVRTQDGKAGKILLHR